MRVRWMGRVRYRDALALQRGIHAGGAASGDYVLLMEHHPVYTLGIRAWKGSPHVLVDPSTVGAELVPADRGGDVTYHGPGQLVGYPIVSVPVRPGATSAHVHGLEQLVIDVLADLGLPGATRRPGFPGVWVEDRKICAVGVRLTRGRSMHGFALNVNTDLSMFSHIVPCGIRDAGVTSLTAEGVPATMADVVEAIAGRAAARWAGALGVERQDVATRTPSNDLGDRTAPRGELGDRGGARTPLATAETVPPDEVGDQSVAEAPLVTAGTAGGCSDASDAPGVIAIGPRKPAWLRAPANMGPAYRELKQTMRSLDLVTVCEEAGCPNIFECWGAGTATFMLNGDRCTRACGFCLVDTRRPAALDPTEPERVAEAVAEMGLAHAVVTAVARDDLPDGGASAFATTVGAIRRRTPTTTVELLIPDCKGDPDALEAIFAARPDVLNHNLETVARLQRAARPSASYARSLAVLARAKAAGLATKSGLMLGMGESEEEVAGALADLRAVGVDIVTIGQYLRPTAAHLPVDRWWHPDEFTRLRRRAEAMGFAHGEASPLTRSSYHARDAVTSVTSPGR
ncbi:MAG TPA: lipoyl synthase [Acidimicrobiales bacterium]|nr:lipoyl synthase [Acidimicrobiales bacterium]